MTPPMFAQDSHGESGNISKMITLSLIIHLIVVSTVFIAIPSSSRHITFGQAYSVQLVGPEIMDSASDSAANIGPLLPSEATHSIIMKKDVSGTTLTPIKKDDAGKKPAIEKALSALRRKETPTPKAIQSEQPPVAASAKPMENLTQNSANSHLNDYYRFIQSRVKRNWILPPSLRPKDNVVTIIEFKILSNGEVERLNFEKRSGNRYVDDSAMKAVQKSIPFPPFPVGMMDRYIEIGIRFPSSDLR